MKIFKIDLYNYFNLKREDNYSGYLTCYIKDNMDRIGQKRILPAMLVIPGGGYHIVSVKEGEPVCLSYLDNNFNCFLLDYTVAPNGYYPVELLEAAMAMIYIYENSDELMINKDNICAIGFSAGGHLCACLTTLYNDEVIINTFGKRSNYVKPRAIILSYAVLSHNVETNEITFENLTNNQKEIMQKLSLDDRVTKDSSPAFIWTTANDKVVPAINSIRYAEACAKHKVPYELHIFGKGFHGSSTVDDKIFTILTEENYQNFSKYLKCWVLLSVAWLRDLNVKMVIKDFDD